MMAPRDTVVKTIFSYDQDAIGPEDGEDPWYAERMFSVPEAVGHSDYYFAWYYDAYNAPWWAIDSIKVTGTGPDVKHAGDADGDGDVDNADATILANHWHMASGATWADGDFNGDYAVDDKDASLPRGQLGLDVGRGRRSHRAGALRPWSCWLAPWPWPGSAIGDAVS